MIARLAALCGEPAQTQPVPRNCRSADASLHVSSLASVSAAEAHPFVASPPSTAPLAFPEPARLAAASDDELRAAGLGYRAPAVRALAAAVAAGELPRAASDWSGLPSVELRQRLLALRGIGPYAAANLCLLLGHYDRLAIDSWLRRAVREAWFGGAAVTDREIEAAFARFGEWQALVYWFHPELHPGRDSWRGAQAELSG